MSAREINKFIVDTPADVLQWSKDFRNNSNDQLSILTFSVIPIVSNDVTFVGLTGKGQWILDEINITGIASIVNCINTSILAGTVNSWDQTGGNVEYHGTTLGNAVTHYNILSGNAYLSSAVIDHTVPSNFSIIAGGNGIATVMVESGFLSGQANTFDLFANEGGIIYYRGDAAADGVTFDPSSPGIIMDETGFLAGGQKIVRDSFMHIASESGSTVYPPSSNVQPYDLQAFEADTTNRPVIFTQNTLGFDPLKANGGFDISWMPVGFEFEMWMLLARFGGTSINQYIKMDVLFFNTSDQQLRHQHGNSNWIDNSNNEKIIFRDHRQSLAEDYITVASFSSAENSHFPGGQDNEFTIIAFSFLMLRGFQ